MWLGIQEGGTRHTRVIRAKNKTEAQRKARKLYGPCYALKVSRRIHVIIGR